MRLNKSRLKKIVENWEDSEDEFLENEDDDDMDYIPTVNRILVCDTYEIILSTNAPVVLGGKIEFHADLLTDGQLKDGDYIFHWKDNSIPQHTYYNETKSPHSNWSVTYSSAEGYGPGVYTVDVSVERVTWINYKLTSKRLDFEVTALLNGELVLTQNGTARTTEFISSESEFESIDFHFVG
ncbi:hypothetical protein HA402_007556 [Bradysia odoriphaga]|nr:hypothetical protein HA402_007556 [Bradysia odoriphaga]